MISEQEKGKIIKVTLEYENSIQVLDGDDAVDWLERTNGMCVFMENRGMNPFNGFNLDKWKETKK